MQHVCLCVTNIRKISLDNIILVALRYVVSFVEIYLISRHFSEGLFHFLADGLELLLFLVQLVF